MFSTNISPIDREALIDFELVFCRGGLEGSIISVLSIGHSTLPSQIFHTALQLS